MRSKILTQYTSLSLNFYRKSTNLIKCPFYVVPYKLLLRVASRDTNLSLSFTEAHGY